MQVFVINLPSAVKRRAFQERQLQKLGLDYVILTATGTDDITDEVIQKHYYDWQRPLRKAEMACYFSHRNTWQKIVIDNQPAFILEDDVLLSQNTAEVLAELDNCIDIDLVDLEVVKKKQYVAKTGNILSNSHKLFKLYLGSSGTGAYVLYPSGAKKLLQCEAKGIALADSYISNCHVLESFQIEPAIAVQMTFYEYYNLGSKYGDCEEFAASSTSADPLKKREWIFRLKRTIAQVKLGFYKLSIMPKSHRRFIKLRRQDFGRNA